MDITTQPLVASVAPGSASGLAGNAASGGTKSPGAFAATLNAMMSANMPQDGTTGTTGLTGIPGLIQLLAPLMLVAQGTGTPASDLSEQQVGALTELLQQPEQADALLTNPDLQDWLLQLQALLAVLMPNQQGSIDTRQATQTAPSEGIAAEDADAANSELSFVPVPAGTQAGFVFGTQPSAEDQQADSATESAMHAQTPGHTAPEVAAEALNPLLFIPLATDALPEVAFAATSSEGKSQPAVTSDQAVQWLNQLKELIQSGSSDPELKQVMKDLPAALVSALASADKSQQPHATAAVRHMLHTTALTKATADNGTAALADVVQIAPNKAQQLEMIARKSVHFISQTDAQPVQEEPLFQPLNGQDVSGTNGQPITVQEFMRQTQNGHPVKMPVLHMPASSFPDDMTKFVVSSFLMETSADGFTEAKLSLYPQHLGHVDVKLTMHNGQLVAQFVADSMAGKEMLESQLSQLRTTLQNHGIQVEKMEVSQSQGFQSGMFQEGRQQQQSGQSAKQQKSASGRIAAMDELVIEETADGGASVRSNDNGSIDVTA